MTWNGLSRCTNELAKYGLCRVQWKQIGNGGAALLPVAIVLSAFWRTVTALETKVRNAEALTTAAKELMVCVFLASGLLHRMFAFAIKIAEPTFWVLFLV
jgi:hypothetical protein